MLIRETPQVVESLRSIISVWAITIEGYRILRRNAQTRILRLIRLKKSIRRQTGLCGYTAYGH